MSDKKSKHREERKRKKSREHSVEKEEKRRKSEKKNEEDKRSKKDKRDEKESDKKYKEEKVLDKREKKEKFSGKNDNEEEENEGGAEKLSLSIEETNKLRAKLGLKPLKVDGDGSDEKKNSTDVHQPAINMGEVKRTAAIKDKLNEMKIKRQIEERMSKVKPIACVADDEEEEDVSSVLSWVAKSRKIETKKKKMDELEKASKEFGVDKLLKKEIKQPIYTSRDVQGITIEHDESRFKEGRDIILTLKDKGVLEEKEDVLVNTNMLDDEAAEENTENRKKKADYNPYEDAEYDDEGNLRQDTILSKYDEVIRGGRLKKTFTVGPKGVSEVKLEAPNIRNMHTLELPKPTLVSEYYTPQELSGKPRKVKAKKVRKKNRLTADDLLNIQKEEERVVKGEVKKDVKEVKKEEDDEEEEWDGYGDLSGVVLEEDGADLELEMTIKKASRINNTKLLQDIKQEIDVKGEYTFDGAVIKEEAEEESGIILNSTAEYCRSLGDVPVVMETVMKKEEEEEDDEEVNEKGTRGWQSVEVEEEPVKEEESRVLDEEPILNKGVGAALMLASKKGYLTQHLNKAPSARVSSYLEAKNYSIEDKRVDDEDKGRSKRDRYSNSGPLMPFREKEGYDPDVKLEYIDDLGREMSKKEAFRFLSHQFHGKGSGLKKVEKRMKKEDLMNKSSTELPLTSIQMLQQKQRHSKLPYVVLASSKAKN